MRLASAGPLQYNRHATEAEVYVVLKFDFRNEITLLHTFKCTEFFVSEAEKNVSESLKDESG
jgi:hypothetical protein